MSTSNSPRLVLVTGAAGLIGKCFAEQADKKKYKISFIKVHSLNEPEKVDPVKSFGEVIEGDLDETESLDKACKGVHTIVHMAGNPDPSAKWDELKKANIEG
jgi:nucleoside-diphosphate-sugar epimerase